MVISNSVRFAARRRLRARQLRSFQRRPHPMAIRYQRQRPVNMRTKQYTNRIAYVQQNRRAPVRKPLYFGAPGNIAQRPTITMQAKSFGRVNHTETRKQIQHQIAGAPVNTTRQTTIAAVVGLTHMPQLSLVGNVNAYPASYQAKLRNNRRRNLRAGPHASNLNTDASLWRSIGMRLSGPLKPNRERFDLFDKEFRAHIVRRYILSNGGLANIGTNLKKADGTVNAAEIAFPIDRIGPMFAISIRPTRYDNLVARLGPWAKHLTHWQGTLGDVLDKNKMVKDGVVVPRLRRGEIGCYDAHYRLWKHISENNIPFAFILEDDADINYGQATLDRINKLFDELKRQSIDYDVIYLGHNNNKRPRKMFGGSIGTPGGVQGLFMYHVTLAGVRKLLEKAIPMTQPVDDYVYVQQPRVKQFTLEPRLGWVVPIERSDTANIM